MKSTFYALLALIFFNFFLQSNFCFSQNEEKIAKQSTISKINSNSNFHPSNTSEKVTAFAEEVYLNCPQYRTSELITFYEAQVNRVSVLELTPEQIINHPLLSTVQLKNKCNPALTNENSNFIVSEFNPLKYFFNYSATEDVFYRIDNTNFVVIIEAEK